MTTMTASEARKNLFKLMDETADSHRPVQITGKRHNAVLVSEEDWRAIEETLYIMSVPGLAESIKAGSKEPLSRSARKLSW
jgi:prevent-host-death family protein